jgi:hypothetical protein
VIYLHKGLKILVELRDSRHNTELAVTWPVFSADLLRWSAFKGNDE